MTPAEHKARCMQMAGELLDYARIKRVAATCAKGEQDIINQKRLLKEAALVEAAANLLDVDRESPAWKGVVVSP